MRSIAKCYKNEGFYSDAIASNGIGAQNHDRYFFSDIIAYFIREQSIGVALLIFFLNLATIASMQAA